MRKNFLIKSILLIFFTCLFLVCFSACDKEDNTIKGTDIFSDTLIVDNTNKTIYGKLSNVATTYSFINEINVAKEATFGVYRDLECEMVIASKTTSVEVGDNVFYILVENGKDISLYIATIRRIPIYTVTFNTNGGTAVQSQQVEEDSLAIEPVTTRAGYTFVGWDYNFLNPITENKIITASWSANTDTPYKVEYYLQNFEDDEYTLKETSNLTGTTDTKAIANIKTYEHFTFNQSKSTINGNINGNGSQTLKVYYTRNKYTLSNENTSYGEISNSGAYKFGTEEKQSTATEYLGCEFVGWFDGETLLSTDKSFIFNVCDKNVTAKFKVKAEMSNLNFTSNATTCTITGIKDKMMKNIVVPDYVTEISENAFHNCSSLTSVTIGSGVTSIGSYAFYKCSSLQSLTIPNSVNSIGRLAFYGCTGLTEIKYNAINCAGLSSENYVFYHAGENGTGITVTIGKNVKKIPAYLFYPTSVDSSYLPKITAVIFEEGSICESIGDWAFSYCSSLTSVKV